VDSLAGIRRIRGVSWVWKPDGPPGTEPGKREAGVIAQEVREVFPELVPTSRDGWLMVDYGGLAVRLGEAVEQLETRLGRLRGEVGSAAASDEQAKESLRPLRRALARIAGDPDADVPEKVGGSDYTALVGALVEAVKELDARVAALETERR
jgi:hypothetical protein